MKLLWLREAEEEEESEMFGFMMQRRFPDWGPWNPDPLKSLGKVGSDIAKLFKHGADVKSIRKVPPIPCPSGDRTSGQPGSWQVLKSKGYFPLMRLGLS